GDQLRLARKRTRLRDEERILLDSDAANESGPVEAGGGLGEFGDRHLVVDFDRIAAVILVPVDSGDLLFKVVDRLRTRGGVRFACQRENILQMLKIGRLQLSVALAILEIEIAVGHADAALVERI